MGRKCTVQGCSFGKHGMPLTCKPFSTCILHDHDRLRDTLSKGGGRWVIVKMIRNMDETTKQKAYVLLPESLRPQIEKDVQKKAKIVPSLNDSLASTEKHQESDPECEKKESTCCAASSSDALKKVGKPQSRTKKAKKTFRTKSSISTSSSSSS